MADNNIDQIVCFEDWQVDFGRCLIVKNQQSQSVEPKVMAVLALLIKHSGEVVSQEDIYAAVWSNGIFNSSLVQRAITLLRKAFKDDPKQAKYIVTYPKKGYSFIPTLITKVNPEYQEVSTNINLLTDKSIYLTAMLILLWVFIGWQLWPTQQPVLSFEYSTNVTSTPEQELFAKPSPDNRSIGFVRQINLNTQQLWQKDLQTHHQQAISIEHHNIHSFDYSIDGRQVAYVVENEQGLNLYSQLISAENDLSRQPLMLARFEQFSHISEIFWLDLTHIVFIGYHRQKKQHQLIKFDFISQQHSILLSQPALRGFVHASLNQQRDQLAYSRLTAENETLIQVINLTNLTVSTIDNTLPPFVHFTWEYADSGLLISDSINQQLLLQFIDGSTKNITIAHSDVALYPHYLSPEKLLLTMQQEDSDIIRWQPGNNHATTMVNSNALDYFPMASPDGKRLLFVSNRDGSNKLYLKMLNHQQQNNVKLLNNSEFVVDRINRPLWSKSGNAIAFIADKQLYLHKLDIDKLIKKDINVDALQVFDWFDDNSLLLLLVKGNHNHLARYHINDNSYDLISEFTGINAHLDDNNNIWQLTSNGMQLYDPDNNRWQDMVSIEGITFSVKSDNSFYLQYQQSNRKFIAQIDVTGEIVKQFTYPFEQLGVLHSVDGANFYFSSNLRRQSDLYLSYSKE
ncbi:winged helix-turn-helix domain-containing protein [Thalassotalea sp. ND16A]|uniref:winged helix-turn-helix domain-containing protein n=1 Tax=Thalassotalea sp. ND16A TaxID=1535422 RepID=UPI00051A67D9|nr:winged helix-turn-helix domain-containing protein [Thalassotalea sp. ND16A]KGJ91949.1 putative transcriptional regulator, CadC [Thalassotalea sp. ND16A]